MSTEDEPAREPGSLQGVKVVDLTTNVAGPFATQVLGDLGADVIKVERPAGDDTRGWGPPYWPDGESVTFSTLNRNKRSVVIDLATSAGKQRLRQLLVEADVVVQSMRPGAFDRLGFSEDVLRELNPGLVQCQITGFGATGPAAMKPAYDPLMQAFSGLMSLTGEPGRAPVRIPVSILDKGSGLWAVIGILNALRLRDRTGRGSTVSTSLLETALKWEPTQLAGVAADGSVAGQLGSATLGIAPYQAFAAKDRHLVVAVGNERLWDKFCRALERPDWPDDERFLTNADRFVNRELLAAEIEDELGRHEAAHWVEVFESVGIPCALIRRVDEVLEDEQVAATGVIEQVEHPDNPRYLMVHTPILTDGRRFDVRRRPPTLGEHSGQGFDAAHSEGENS